MKLTNADVDGVLADVSLKSELQAAADAVITCFGRAHIAVNNAGVTGRGGYGAWSGSSWNWTIGVNLMAVIWDVENDWPYIFTDNKFEPFIEARFARIKEGYDQVSGRERRHWKRR